MSSCAPKRQNERPVRYKRIPIEMSWMSSNVRPIDFLKHCLETQAFCKEWCQRVTFGLLCLEAELLPRTKMLPPFDILSFWFQLATKSSVLFPHPKN